MSLNLGRGVMLLLAATLLAMAAFKVDHWVRAPYHFAGRDPVFPFIGNRPLVGFTIVAETVVALFLVTRRKWQEKGFALVGLGGLFLGYRTAKWFLGIQAPCKCLGSLPTLLALTPYQADTLGTLIAAVLVVIGLPLMLSPAAVESPRAKA